MAFRCVGTELIFLVMVLDLALDGYVVKTSERTRARGPDVNELRKERKKICTRIPSAINHILHPHSNLTN